MSIAQIGITDEKIIVSFDEHFARTRLLIESPKNKELGCLVAVLDLKRKLIQGTAARHARHAHNAPMLMAILAITADKRSWLVSH